MARLQYHNGETLHHFSGYGDGHLPVNTLIQLIQSNINFVQVKNNIINCEVLVIDEIGLISAKMFEAVEQICRTVRGNEVLFGGIQVVASGSFVQLPPVPSCTDEGRYCFESDIFKKLFAHKYHLNQVFRQKEIDLINAINELCLGCPSTATDELMKGLNRPLPPDVDPIYIFGTNLDVDFFNHEKLKDLPGEPTIYKSTDDGDKKYLRKCSAPMVVALKLNSKVVVTRNLNNGLVNGLSGTVVQMMPDKVVIKIDKDKYLGHQFGGKEFEIVPYTFCMRNAQNNVVAVRKQIPLRLGYALTVDKAQGRSIEYLVIDAYNFWKPGQLGVAVGRAVTKDGLQVQNYNTFASTLKHPEKVTQFNEKKSAGLKGDKSCCTVNVRDHQFNLVVQFGYHALPLNCALQEDEQDADQSSTSAKEERRLKMRFPFDVEEFLESLMLPELDDDDIHAERNDTLRQLNSSNNFMNFLNRQYTEVKNMLNTYKIPTKQSKCNWCLMTRHLHNYVASSGYAAACKKAFNTQDLKKLQNQLCTDVVFGILEKIVTEEKNRKLNVFLQELCDDNEEVDISSIDNNMNNKVRYIAGATIHHICDKLKKNVNHQILKKCYGEESSFRAFRIVSTLRIPQSAAIATSSNVNSLQETIRKQGMKEGLTHVTDQTFKFFCVLYLKASKFQSQRAIEINAFNMHQFARKQLNADVDLIELWLNLFQNVDCCCQPEESEDTLTDSDDSIWVKIEMEHCLIMNMYEMAINYFVKTHLGDVVRLFKDFKGKKKGYALRPSLGPAEKKKHVIPKNVDFPCGVCRKECPDVSMLLSPEPEQDSVQCDECDNWYHLMCVNLTGNEPALKKGSTLPYYCPSCVNEKDLPSTSACTSAVRGRGRGRGRGQGRGAGKGKGRGKTSDRGTKRPLQEEYPDKSPDRSTPSTRSGRTRKKPDKLNL